MVTIKENKDLKDFNTFAISASARYFAEYNSVAELRELLAFRRKKENETNCECRLLHIGGGSNLLFLQDFDGLVLHSAIHGIEVLEESSDDITIRVGSGVVFDDLVQDTIAKGWYGLENLSIIPGEVGASAVQNIGAYGIEAKDFIAKVELVDLQTGEEKVMTNEECLYSYRFSIFKTPEYWGKYAVTYVQFKLSKHFNPRLEYGGLKKAVEGLVGEDINTLSAQMLRQIIVDMRNSKLPDPKVLGNAGSFFMNPIVSRQQYAQLIEVYPNMPHYDVDDNRVKVPAGWLIEQSGWKGKRLGNAGVYEKQALVLVNHGNATGADVVKLSDAVRKDVLEKFDIDIHPEVNFIK